MVITRKRRGVGVGMGTTIAVEKLASLSLDRFAQGWIPLVGAEMDFLEAVWLINAALDRGVDVVAAILKRTMAYWSIIVCDERCR